MTTTLSSKGRIVIPRAIRLKMGLKQGDNFLVLSSSTGEISLRPIKRLGKNLIQSLRVLRGLNLQRHDEPIRDLKL